MNEIESLFDHFYISTSFWLLISHVLLLSSIFTLDLIESQVEMAAKLSSWLSSFFLIHFCFRLWLSRYRGCEANYYFVTRCLWKPEWLTCFKVSWTWLSQLISFYLLFLNLVAKAHDYPAPSTYACEDITRYYSHEKHLRGEALKKKLNSIVAPHHSLSYKEVSGFFKSSAALVLIKSLYN